ncbi:MAG: hypothetical protein Q9182_005289 [Xanthomendoza sp. 2 TL-2023]
MNYPRRSARLRQLREQTGPKEGAKQPYEQQQQQQQQLPSPSTSVQRARPSRGKRKLSSSPEAALTEEAPLKKLRHEPSSNKLEPDHPLGSIAQWASTGQWSATCSDKHSPQLSPSRQNRSQGRFWRAAMAKDAEPAQVWEVEEARMSQLSSSKPSSGKRKSSSVHRVERIKKLARYGISMKLSNELEESARRRCEGFLEGTRVPSHCPGYSAGQLPTALDRAQNLNEARLCRDITPWVVPSAEHSYWNGEITLQYLVDEVQADWSGCAPMDGTRPKPDLTIGISPDHFDEEEIKKLKSFSSFERPSFVTPNLCYPFFIVEAKTGEEGLNKADLQNAHSAGIAVNTILELQKAAFEVTAPKRVEELFRKPLVFSVSHDGTQAKLYAHFAAPSDSRTGAYTIQRCEIDAISFFRRGGADRFKPYNFTLNVYQDMGQEHRKRIKEALAALPASSASGLSLGTSAWTMETASQQDSTQDEPTSGARNEKADMLAEQLRKVHGKMEQMEQRMKVTEAQLKSQRDINMSGNSR